MALLRLCNKAEEEPRHWEPAWQEPPAGEGMRLARSPSSHPACSGLLVLPPALKLAEQTELIQTAMGVCGKSDMAGKEEIHKC